MSYATLTGSKIDDLFANTNGETIYVALFRDPPPDETNLVYTGSGDESEYLNELTYWPGVVGYTRQAVSFGLVGISNGIVTYANTADITWTNTGTVNWPAPNYVSYFWTPTIPVNNSQYEFQRLLYSPLQSVYVKNVEPGDQYILPAGTIRIAF